MIDLRHGDCLDVLKTLADNSVHAVVTDPPYGLSFMGKRWDYDVPSVDIWAECLRVLKPGGHLLAFAGTRTQHRMAVRIEDAGFEIRDMIAWLYGSGFPKSLDVSKAIDKAAGAVREVIGVAGKSGSVRNSMAGDFAGGEYMATAPATDAARQWQGWGTAFKPAMEPVTVARKPLIGTVAENVLAHGTGAINVDRCRVAYATDADKAAALAGDAFKRKDTSDKGWSRPWMQDQARIEQMNKEAKERADAGRWPANVIHDGSEEVLAGFPVTTSGNLSPHHKLKASDNRAMSGPNQERSPRNEFGGDSGSAARFFYCAKASKRDREEGLSAFAEQPWVQWQTGNGASGKPSSMSEGRNTAYRNTHPTVKPTDLMRYLVRLVTPPGGVVLDPFMGSGSTGKAAKLEGFGFIGIEREEQYIQIARARIEAIENRLNV